MIVAQSESELRRAVAAARAQGLLIGCVPTMGALHEGHLSLIRVARRECGYVVVTIFVNPTQFGPAEDFARYPRPIEKDLAHCRDAGIDLVFQPDVDVIYPRGFSTFVEVEGLSSVLEGAMRPGHFRGVATVVTKLFQLVEPDRAYFGQKDYQQQLLLRKMCEDLGSRVEIRTCPTVRERDGLALSSRNQYLDPTARRNATVLFEALRCAERRLGDGEDSIEAVHGEMLQVLQSVPGVTVDYAVIADPKTLAILTRPQSQMVALVAARVGGTRLIDNLLIDRKE